MKILLILSQIICVCSSSQFLNYVSWTSLGCWHERHSLTPRVIPALEGTNPILDGSYAQRANAIEKCARAAFQLGYEIFALQDGGWCGSSADARYNYKKLGDTSCISDNGKGLHYINHVYELLVKDDVYSGSFETVLSSSQPKRKVNVLYNMNICLSSAPRKMNATARVWTAGEQATFNVTVISRSTLSTLVELERTDKPTGWSSKQIFIDWTIYVKPTF